MTGLLHPSHTPHHGPPPVNLTVPAALFSPNYLQLGHEGEALNADNRAQM